MSIIRWFDYREHNKEILQRRLAVLDFDGQHFLIVDSGPIRTTT